MRTAVNNAFDGECVDQNGDERRENIRDGLAEEDLLDGQKRGRMKMHAKKTTLRKTESGSAILTTPMPVKPSTISYCMPSNTVPSV